MFNFAMIYSFYVEKYLVSFLIYFYLNMIIQMYRFTKNNTPILIYLVTRYT